MAKFSMTVGYDDPNITEFLRKTEGLLLSTNLEGVTVCASFKKLKERGLCEEEEKPSYLRNTDVKLYKTITGKRLAVKSGKINKKAELKLAESHQILEDINDAII